MIYLADTSAFHVLSRDVVDAYGWQSTIEAGLVGLSDLSELEIMYSAQSPIHAARVRELLRQALPYVPVPDGVYERARDVQSLLIGKSEHRGPGPVDLLTAATAEIAGLTLLHRDNDFETVARHTGQPTEMLPAR